MHNKNLYEKTVDTKRIYEGKILNLRVDQVLLPNGREASREVIEHSGAVCILPLTSDNKVYMVRQFRYPFNEEMLEVPAGKLEPGEVLSDAANRELEEETGMKAGELIYLGEFRPSVAYLTEKIHMYLARGLWETQQHLDEDEFLNIEVHSLDSLVEMAMQGEITDGKTVAILLKVKRIVDAENKK